MEKIYPAELYHKYKRVSTPFLLFPLEVFRIFNPLNSQFLLTKRRKCGNILRSQVVRQEFNTETYRSGHNGAHSKGSRAHHSATCESSCFLAISRKCFIFLEFWMTAFHYRPCKSRAKFKHNQIRRDIEVVITGLTRNQFESNLTRVRIPLSPPKFVGSFKSCRLFLYNFSTFDGRFLDFLNLFRCCRVVLSKKRRFWRELRLFPEAETI